MVLKPTKKQDAWLRKTSVPVRSVSFSEPQPDKACPTGSSQHALSTASDMLAASGHTLEVLPPPSHAALTVIVPCRAEVPPARSSAAAQRRCLQNISKVRAVHRKGKATNFPAPAIRSMACSRARRRPTIWPCQSRRGMSQRSPASQSCAD